MVLCRYGVTSLLSAKAFRSLSNSRSPESGTPWRRSDANSSDV